MPPDFKDLWLRHSNAIVPAAIFLFAFVLRFYYMADGLWHTDSVIMAYAVEKTVESGRLHYMHGIGYPGQVVVASAIFILEKIFLGAQNSEHAITFASVLFGSLSVVAMYFLSKELSKSVFVGVAAASVLSVLPIHLAVSTYAKSHAPELFFLFSSFYFALVAGKKDSRKLKVVAGLFLGTALSIRLTSLQLTPVFFLMFWRKRFPLTLEQKGGLMKFKFTKPVSAVAADLALLIAPAAAVLILMYYPMISSQGISPIVAANQYNRFLGVYSQVFKLSVGWAMISITNMGLVLACAGLIILIRKDRYLGFVLIVWAVASFVYYANVSTTEPRYVIPALSAMVYLMAVALDFIREKINPPVSVILMLAVMYFMFTAIQPIVTYRSDFTGAKEFALQVKGHTEPNAVILVMDESYHIQYYANRTPMTHPGAPSDADVTVFIGKIRTLINEGTPVYAMTTAFSYDSGDGLKLNPTTRQIVNSNTGKTYEKIKIDPATGTVRAPNGLLMQLSGKIMLEVMDNFDLTPVLTYDNEDWHKRDVTLSIQPETLYKLTLPGQA